MSLGKTKVLIFGMGRTHASVMRLLAEEDGIPLAQFGVRALCAEEAETRERVGIFYRDGEELVSGNVSAVDLPADFPTFVYVSFVLDGLDPSLLPATGTPVPGGLGFWQALHIVEHALKGRKLVGCDVVELAPDATSRVSDFAAAQVAYALIGLA